MGDLRLAGAAQHASPVATTFVLGNPDLAAPDATTPS
jgi:hypothetical protein